MPRAKIMTPEHAREQISKLMVEEAREYLIFLCGAFSMVRDQPRGTLAWKIFTGAMGKPGKEPVAKAE